MALVNETTGLLVAASVKRATTFWQRLKGLMFTKTLPEGSALYLSPCRSIHTYFMKYPIDVVYLSENHEVLAFEHQLHPNKLGQMQKGTKIVLELPVGTIEASGTKVGHIIK